MMQSVNGSVQFEQEKDANSFLVELDKGLRSGKVGEQCESIVRFPNLFEKYPFPIVINSAFLKLADVFREGTNLMRLCVYKVCQQSEKHLDKILSVEEFLQRVYYVIHSNDPVARAITLRTLGSVARIISERKDVHHSVLNGLDSHDSVELEAAIFAAERFAAQSKSFACSICGKLSEMIEGLATPFDTKLKLIPVFQHMHHEPRTTLAARELFIKLLPNYPAHRFVLVTLHVLSKLAAKSLFDIPEQVALLLDYLEKDVRRSVKVLALKEMAYLAREAPHMWTELEVNRLCDFALKTTYGGLQLGCIDILVILAKSVAVNHFSLKEGSVTVECCQKYIYDTSCCLAAKASELYAEVVIHAASDGNRNNECSEHIETVSLAVENLLLIATTLPDSQIRNLEQCLLCVVKLCTKFRLLTDRFVETIISSLPTLPDKFAVAMCECLTAISSQQTDLLHSLLPDLVRLTNEHIEGKPQHYTLTTLLVTLLFQACVGEFLPEHVTQVVNKVLESVNCWVAYKLARQATRYGHHEMAAGIFHSIYPEVGTETSAFWICSLHDFCNAERSLLQGSTTVTAFLKNASKAEQFYQKAITELRAATSTSCSLAFQCDYLRVRSEMLQSYCQLVRACSSFKTSPPPAIATSLAMTTGQEIHRCSHVLQQLQSCVDVFESLVKKYLDLYQASFDADQASLTSLQLLKQNCQAVIYIIETIIAKAKGTLGKVEILRLPTIQQQGSLGAQQHLQQVLYDDLLTQLKSACMTESALPLSYHHMECIEKSVLKLVQLPLSLPRFYFQRLQATEIKLAVSPQPRSATEPVTVHFDTQLTVKVEGVTQHSQRLGLLRKINRVRISVSSQQLTKGQMVAETKRTENPDNKMQETVEPQNDYFSVAFLFSFPVAGTHQIDINTHVLDEEDSLWNTGPQTTLQDRKLQPHTIDGYRSAIADKLGNSPINVSKDENLTCLLDSFHRDRPKVKSYDEGVQKQQQQQYAAQRQQQRAALQQHLTHSIQS